MKILYAIQGTGNGHVARSLEIIPILKKLGDVDLVLSGNQCDIALPWKVKYRLRGASFIFGQKGGVNIFKTLKNINFINFLIELNKIPVKDYDIILNDFEPVTAWACKLKKTQCIGVSHQSAVLHKNAPKPLNNSPLGKAILKYYAPACKNYSFHFKSLGSSCFTPVIRKEIREINPITNNHYTVYLPSYKDELIIEFLLQFKNTDWNVFSKHTTKKYKVNNIFIQPVSNHPFVASLATGKGVLCNAGFETPAEALYMKKKLCVLPMKGQYEQQCNAAMLKEIGVPVYKSLETINVQEFSKWLTDDNVIPVNYVDDTNWIISTIVKAHACNKIEAVYA